MDSRRYTSARSRKHTYGKCLRICKYGLWESYFNRESPTLKAYAILSATEQLVGLCQELQCIHQKVRLPLTLEKYLLLHSHSAITRPIRSAKMWQFKLRPIWVSIILGLSECFGLIEQKPYSHTGCRHSRTCIQKFLPTIFTTHLFFKRNAHAFKDQVIEKSRSVPRPIGTIYMTQFMIYC